MSFDTLYLASNIIHTCASSRHLGKVYFSTVMAYHHLSVARQISFHEAQVRSRILQFILPKSKSRNGDTRSYSYQRYVAKAHDNIRGVVVVVLCCSILCVTPPILAIYKWSKNRFALVPTNIDMIHSSRMNVFIIPLLKPLAFWWCMHPRANSRARMRCTFASAQS